MITYKQRNQCILYLRLIGEIYIFIGALKGSVQKEFLVEKDFDEKNYSQLIFPIEFILDDTYFVNSPGILEEREPYCKYSCAKKYVRKLYDWRLLYLENGTSLGLKLKDIDLKNVKESSI